MPPFNEHSPAALGVEWSPVHEDTLILNSVTNPLSARLTPAASETVNTAWFFASKSTSGVAESYQVDIYEEGDFPGDLVSVTEYPSSTPGVIGTVSTWNGSVVGSGSEETFVDGPGMTPVTMPAGFVGQADDDFIYTSDGSAYLITFTFDGLASATAGKHIVKVNTTAKVQAFSTIGDVQAFSARPYLIIDGNPYWGALQTFAGPALGGHTLSADWFVNPQQLRGWLPGDFTGFDSGTNTDAAGWFVAATGSIAIINVIYQTSMTVVHAGTDQRKAFGWVTPAQHSAGELFGTPAWFPMDLVRPDGGSGWYKTLGIPYRLTLRRQSVEPGGKQLWVQSLAGYGDSPVNGWEHLVVKHRPASRLPYSSKLVEDGKSWGPALALEVGGVSSIDSQPYAALDLDSEIYIGVDFRQYFTTPGTLPVTTFPLLRALIGRVRTTASGPITLRVRRASDNVQMGSTVTITSEDFDAYTDDAGHQTFYAHYKLIISKMNVAATLAISTQYYFQVTSSAEEPETGWRIETFRSIRGLEPDTEPPNIEDVTYGGASNEVEVTGVSHPETDAALLLLTLPAPPTALVAAQAHTSPCVQYVALTWTGTSLGADFNRYEVQRKDSAAEAWYPIAYITDEAVVAFDDWETRRGRTAYYRIRVMRNDTAISNWSATASAVAEAPCCGYIFTSNQAPNLTVWITDLFDTNRKTDLPQNVEVVQFYDRDYQVAFHELERRGARFTRSLVVAVDNALDSTEATSAPGLETFSDLLAITRPNIETQLPYVCVVEETGDRWFASVLTPEVSRVVDGDLHIADVEIIETTSIPTPVQQ